MKTEKQILGKVSITCNGQWTDKVYDRLCLVHDGFYASYISKKAVPEGVPLSNEEYWQPVAKLSAEFKKELGIFETNILKALALVQIKLAGTRLVVANEEERINLTIDEIVPGCEVYEKDSKRTYILESINTENVKTWHLESDSKIDSTERDYIEGRYLYLTADRAVADGLGNIIHDTYLTRKDTANYINKVIKDYLLTYNLQIPKGSIIMENLSAGLIEFIGSKGNVTNNPDEEDLTIVENTLKLKDRKYIENTFNGKGYKILRKNMVGQLNLLEQADINEPNTIYEVRYDFCLNETTINIPENSTLLFTGGKLMNGVVVLHNTKLQNVIGPVSEYLDCTIQGTFKEGQMIYDEDLKKMILYNGTDWVNLDGSTI